MGFGLELTRLIQEVFGPVGCIAGVATAGIPQGVLIAQELGLPFIYVRAKPKDHGTGNLIEGEVLTGKRVVVVEDLISTGKSSLQAVEALRAADYDVAGLAAIFSYGFDVANENFKQANCPFVTLSNYGALIKYAAEHQYISGKDVELLTQWREAPAEWALRESDSLLFKNNPMNTFESKITIAAPVEKVYGFLADFNNHQKLVPEEMMDWKSTADTASFRIQNMGKLSLAIKTRNENSEINIVAVEKPPFDINLKWELAEKDGSTEVKFTISADLNMMLKLVASGPLQKLANHETKSLALNIS
eukprot:gene15778-15934_t